jgi:putative Mg2+ transporter-C (MgtC) family protein
VPDVSQLDVFIRVLVAASLGALVGIERERHTVAAGIRTHMLVAVGACLLTGTVQLVAQESGVEARADVLRIASGIATGVGFIGAGTIIMTRGRVKGLTTAATIWVTAAVGITAGFGFLLLALLVAGPVTVSILMLGFVEKRLQGGGLLQPDYPTTAREVEAERRGAAAAERDAAGAAGTGAPDERAGGAGDERPGTGAGRPPEDDDDDESAQSGLSRWRPRGDG